MCVFVFEVTQMFQSAEASAVAMVIDAPPKKKKPNLNENLSSRLIRVS